jgi:hypothetical protein
MAVFMDDVTDPSPVWFGICPKGCFPRRLTGARNLWLVYLIGISGMLAVKDDQWLPEWPEKAF